MYHIIVFHKDRSPHGVGWGNYIFYGIKNLEDYRFFYSVEKDIELCLNSFFTKPFTYDILYRPRDADPLLILDEFYNK